jgi:thymidylate synthase (FAD)
LGWPQAEEFEVAIGAQAEIRAYATTIGNEIVSRWVPIVWEAFLDYRRNSLVLSSIEREIIAALAASDPGSALAIAKTRGLLSLTDTGELMPNRERAELDEKLESLGLVPPWT